MLPLGVGREAEGGSVPVLEKGRTATGKASSEEGDSD